MLTLFAPSPAARHRRYCDGFTRRSFLRVGALGFGGMMLPQLLQSEALATSGAVTSGGAEKSVIVVYLSGGLAHQDSFDMKPNAPEGIRGEFNPIASNVPGIEVCELMPKLATSADKYAVVRSVVGMRDEHSSFQSMTGFNMSESQRDGRPHFGSYASQLLGQAEAAVPTFVDLFPTMQHRPYNSPGPGVLGRAHAGVKADGEELATMKLQYVSRQRFGGRRRLLDEVDSFRRNADGLDLSGFDPSYQQAFDVLTSSKLVEALDVEREDTAIRERYGKGSPKHQGDGAPLWNEQLLMARRLIEIGVRCVTVAYGFWDTHGNNFGHLKNNLPTFDQGISALIEDIYDRGLNRDVMLLVCDEFGRTPKINEKAGRDHWARVNCALFAGGGIAGGQVIGSTDDHAGEAASRPIHYQDVLATVYRHLGIDPHQFVRDRAQRPMAILPVSARPIREFA